MGGVCSAGLVLVMVSFSSRLSLASGHKCQLPYVQAQWRLTAKEACEPWVGWVTPARGALDEAWLPRAARPRSLPCIFSIVKGSSSGRIIAEIKGNVS